MDDLCLSMAIMVLIFICGMAAGYLLRDVQVKHGIYPRKDREDDPDEEAEAEIESEAKDPEIVKAADLPKKDGE